MNELTYYVEDSIGGLEPDCGSDPVLAKILIDTLENKEEQFKAISSDGSLFIFNGIYWDRVKHNDLISMALLFDGLWLPGEKPKRLTVNLTKAKSIAETTLLIHDKKHDGMLDEVPAGVAALDGFWTVDENGCELLEHSPDNLCTWSYDFELSQDRPVKWLQFLDSLWKNDADKEDKIEALREWIGCALIGKGVDFARAALFLGSGGNGKSVLCRAVESLFPDEQVTSASPKQWDSDYTIATLRDSRLNVVAELPEYKALEASDMFKSVIAGDRISGRIIYQPPFTFTPRASHLFSANNLPSIPDTSSGFFRRFLVLSFNRSFTNDYALERRSQTDIMDDINKERPAIVYWALEGASRLLRRGEYTLPASHLNLIEQWHQDSDPVKDFILSCCTKGESPLADLYDDFKEYCIGTGRKAGSNKGLAKKLRLHGYKPKKTKGGTSYNLQTKVRADWDNFNSTPF